jgi:hypothetical protein
MDAGPQQTLHAMWLSASPEFSGTAADEPESFIKDCKAKFPLSYDESHKVRAASRNLLGDADSWWSKYSGLPIPWGSFKDYCGKIQQ